MRDAFISATSTLLDEDPRTALVLAEISAAAFQPAIDKHPDRAINVGIREQLMIGVAGGLALTGMRPIAHSYATFVIDRAYEQIKLDLGHQGSGAILVSVGASYDGSSAGYTHMSPMDVSLLDTLPGWTVHVPGHPSEVAPLLQAAARTDDRVYIRLSTQVNARPYPQGIVKRGNGPVVVAVGPMLQPVLDATEGLDVTVVYTHTPRPFDVDGLRALEPSEVVLAEPYLKGSSAHLLEGLNVRSLGVGREDLHRFGSPSDHAVWHGLDAASIRIALDPGSRA